MNDAMTEPLPADFPKTIAEWEAIIAAAPGEETPEAAAIRAAFDAQAMRKA
jgi:hypothetical protein